ncbi:MAG: diacylglycerol kinase family lipid kinase [Bacteroidales bacterium]|nr:diacylglycerol kinase family lipid kinase [Bacteroidales bacterium]MDD4384754.1 diacylglycerol kinase family lipid kinase [Bacteroidales bacterium]MDY0199259.1 diacylglycerol kinase family lipid kinase [Tenuifilaceae bacterium]
MENISCWYTIVNPEAGSGKGLKDWPRIEALLNELGIKFEHKITERKYHTIELTVNAVRNGFRKILVVGGDGTLNEVVNGIFIQNVCNPIDIIIGVIGVGTGNDWQRTFKLPSDYRGKILAIKEERTILQDVGKVRFFEARIQQSRYFANAAGVGFDAKVALATNKLKESGRKGKLLYIYSLLKTLYYHRSTMAKIAIDSHKLDGKIFSATLGIGKYNGGGMLQLPNALPDDGLFDITVINKIRRVNVLRNIFRLYNGTILNHPKILGYQGKNITISSKPPLSLEADGESLGTSPFTFSIVPQSIRVIVGADFTSINNPISNIYN